MKEKVGGTPLIYNGEIGCFLKLECENPSGSHKDRETLYLMNKYGWDKSYIIISSGNAGISLAYWMHEKATVLVPEITPKEKIRLIQSFGAKVIIKGKYYSESYRLVEEIARKMNLINISPGFVDRWRGDIQISYELGHLKPDYVFVPSANHTLALGIAYGFQEMKDKGIIERIPTVVSCVLPNHPFIKLTEEIDERYKETFNSIYTFGEDGRNLRKEFLNYPFTKVDSTLKLEKLIKLCEKYPNFDPAVSLAVYLSRKYSGVKVVIATGLKRT